MYIYLFNNDRLSMIKILFSHYKFCYVEVNIICILSQEFIKYKSWIRFSKRSKVKQDIICKTFWAKSLAPRRWQTSFQNLWSPAPLNQKSNFTPIPMSIGSLENVKQEGLLGWVTPYPSRVIMWDELAWDLGRSGSTGPLRNWGIHHSCTIQPLPFHINMSF